MRVVITGSTSMIGTALIEECVKRKDEVLAVIRSSTKRMNRLSTSPLVKVEYADLEELSSIIGDGKPYDVFYHLAWGSTSKDKRDNPVIQERNIKATLEAVNVAHQLGCKKFIGAGSQAECGYVETRIDENTECNPESAYGMSKLSAMMLSKRMCQQLGMTHIWGRIFSVYGIHDNVDTMINYAIKHFMNDENAEFSIATNIWNYLYESDAGTMFYLLGKKDVDSGVYNVASLDSRPLKAYVEEMAKVINTKGKPYFASKQQGRLLNLNVDISKIVKAIDYVPTTDFETGIGYIIESRRKSGDYR